MSHVHEPIELYHYTTFEGLKGILESKKLWLTDYQCTNDLSEFGYSKAIFLNRIKRGYEKWSKEKKISPLCIKKLDSIIQEECTFLYETIKQQIDKIGGAYLFSACVHKSDFERSHGLLSMWRGYGREGGYALEIDFEEFKNSYTRRCQIFDFVRYPALLQENIDCSIEHFLNEDCEIKKYLAQLDDFIEHSLIPAFIEGKPLDLPDKDIEAILALITLLKHPGFSEESEYRCVILRCSKEKMLQGQENDFLKTNLRKRKGHVLSYIEIPFDPKCIKRIIIGPKSHQKSHKKHFQEYLKSLELDCISVKSSEIPYIENR